MHSYTVVDTRQFFVRYSGLPENVGDQRRRCGHSVETPQREPIERSVHSHRLLSARPVMTSGDESYGTRPASCETIEVRLVAVRVQDVHTTFHEQPAHP